MKKYLVLTLLSLSSSLFAIGDNPDTLAQDETAPLSQQASVTDMTLKNILPRFDWHLVIANDSHDKTLSGVITQGHPPITLRFDSNQLLSVTNTCNQLSAGFSINEGDNGLVIGQVAQTMRACIDPDMALKDDAMIALLSNLTESRVVSAQNEKTPELILTDKNGNRFVFTGVMTPEAYFNQTGEVMFLEVSAETVACDLPEANSQCLQIREIQYDENYRQIIPNETWIAYPNQIAGYTHTAGTRNIIRVKRFVHDENTPKDTTKPNPFYSLELVVEASNVN